MKKRIFIRKKYGRLGNNLYRWAHLIAFARENGAEVWDLSRTTSQYFRFFPKLNRKLLPIVAERKCFSMGSPAGTPPLWPRAQDPLAPCACVEFELLKQLYSRLATFFRIGGCDCPRAVIETGGSW